MRQINFNISVCFINTSTKKEKHTDTDREKDSKVEKKGERVAAIKLLQRNWR